MFWKGVGTECSKCQTGLEDQFKCRLNRKRENFLLCSFPASLADTGDENGKNEKGFMQKGPPHSQVKKIKKRSFLSSINPKL